jgi:hypothetical protein
LICVVYEFSIFHEKIVSFFNNKNNTENEIAVVVKMLNKKIEKKNVYKVVMEVANKFDKHSFVQQVGRSMKDRVSFLS